jgi:membrane-anchored mycosin MYCP
MLPAFAAATLLAVSGTLLVPVPAAAQPECDRLEPANVVRDVPLAQRLFDLEAIRPLSQGRGVTVAVIDSGVDDDNPQLDDGQVLAGEDFTEEGGTDGRVDCVGHGTGVASIIAASAADGIGFAGLAPRVEILPVRVTVRETEPNDPERPTIPASAFADAIRYATAQGVEVINASIAFPTDSQAIRDAVQDAVNNGVIVVAAAGNRPAEEYPDEVAYPAAYDEVVSVGAITPDGLRLTETYVGPTVDLLAPGSGTTVAWPGEGHAGEGQGTSHAAPFVSAAAALVLAANPQLTATEVIDRLKATADPAPGSAAENPAGVVNPYRALTGQVAGGAPVVVPPPSEPAVDPVAQARAERWDLAVQRALLIVLIAVFLTALGFTAAAVWRRGQRHRWLPGQRRDPVFPHPMIDEPDRAFYTIPTPRSRR